MGQWLRRGRAARSRTGFSRVGRESRYRARQFAAACATSQIVFRVLAAEIAVQRNLFAPAYQTYLMLARETHDPRMAQRAAEIALYARSPSDALAAARVWCRDAPHSGRAAR